MKKEKDIIELLKNKKNLGELNDDFLDELNDQILNLAKNPSTNNLQIIISLIKKIPQELTEKVILNLVYAIGEIGKSNEIPSDIIKFLNNFYYKSDQWVRKEIIESLGKIGKGQDLDENLIQLFYNSLKDDYVELRLKALEILATNKKYQSIKYAYILISFLDSQNLAIKENASKILKMLIKEENTLVEILTNSKLKLNKFHIRNLVVLFSDSVFKLYKLKEALDNSNLSEEIKGKFFSEIETIIKIISK